MADLGLPENIKKIDAVLYINDTIQILEGNKFWEYQNNKIVSYPLWNDVPIDVDTAFNFDRDDITYFFRDEKVYKYNNIKRQREIINDNKFSILGCLNNSLIIIISKVLFIILMISICIFNKIF